MSAVPISASVATEASPSARPRGGPKARLAPYIFVGPFALLFITFTLIPLVSAIWRSLFATTRSGLGFGTEATTRFVGIQNFITALQNEEFVAGFGRVLLFGIVQVPIMLGAALILALLFDSAAVRFKRFFQLASFLPWAVPGVVAALLWGFLYQPRVSPIVDWLAAIGVEANFLAPQSVLWSIANVTTWSFTGVNMLVMFTALQNIPRELFEAARIDGASEWQTAWRIKVPIIAPAILLTTMFSIIGTLQLFNEPTVMRTITSNVGSHFTPNMAIFFTTTNVNNPYVGSAMAILLGLVTLVLSLIVSKFQKRGQA